MRQATFQALSILLLLLLLLLLFHVKNKFNIFDCLSDGYRMIMMLMQFSWVLHLPLFLFLTIDFFLFKYYVLHFIVHILNCYPLQDLFASKLHVSSWTIWTKWLRCDINVCIIWHLYVHRPRYFTVKCHEYTFKWHRGYCSVISPLHSSTLLRMYQNVAQTWKNIIRNQ